MVVNSGKWQKQILSYTNFTHKTEIQNPTRQGFLKCQLVTSQLKLFTKSTLLVPGGGGVLKYISDGDVQSPSLGLKFAI